MYVILEYAAVIIVVALVGMFAFAVAAAFVTLGEFMSWLEAGARRILARSASSLRVRLGRWSPDTNEIAALAPSGVDTLAPGENRTTGGIHELRLRDVQHSL